MRAMPPPTWPFDQPPNCAVLTLRSIVFGGAPILYVSHDADDHGWQIWRAAKFPKRMLPW
jgi:hypothetical protein